MRRSLRAGLAVAGLATLALVSWAPLRPGLVARFYRDADLHGEPVVTVRDRSVDLTLHSRLLPFAGRAYGIRWSGFILIDRAGEYRFGAQGPGRSVLRIDGRTVVANPGRGRGAARTGKVALDSGFHEIAVDYFHRHGRAPFTALWQPPGRPLRPLAEAVLFSTPPSAARYRLYRWRGIALGVLAAAWLAFILAAAVTSRARARLSAATWGLALFWLAAVPGLDLALAPASSATVFYSRFFLQYPTHGRADSWAPMLRGERLLSERPDEALYPDLFFHQHVKFQYPPTSLLWLAPFRAWPGERLALAANFASWLAVLISALFLERVYSLALVLYGGGHPPEAFERALRTILMALFTLGFYPIVRGWWGGQIQTMLYALFVAALWCWLGRHRGAAGVLIGIICSIKPPLGLLAVWGLVRREWRFVAGLAGAAGSLGLVSLASYGWKNHLDYLRTLSYIGHHGESYAPNQSVNGLLHRLLHEGNNLHWVGNAFAPYDPWVYAATLLSSAGLIALALFWRRPRAAGEPASALDFSLAVLTFTMASPVAWQHHYGVVLPILAVAFSAALGARRRGAVAALAATYLLVGTYTTLVDRFAATPWNVLQSYLFFGAVLGLGMLYFLRGIWDRSPARDAGTQVSAGG